MTEERPYRRLLTDQAEARVRKNPGLDGIVEHLGTALALEQATIPPYLTALYSIKEGSNQEAAEIIQSVAMEEMLHFLQVANLILALGRQPRIDVAGFVPPYPTYLPNSDHRFLVGLEKFSQQSIETFMKIELPGEPHAEPQFDHYATIGQFYAAIELALEELCLKVGEGKIFQKKFNHWQLPSDMYYGGGGKLVEVVGMETARLAIQEIVDQGEGIRHTVFDGDDVHFGGHEEPAHYFRFHEVYVGRHYTADDTPESGPTGEVFEVDWGAVHDMRPRPTKWQYWHHDKERWRKSHEFDLVYTDLLRRIQDSVDLGVKNADKRRQSFLGAVGSMYELKYKAQALMQIPVTDEGGDKGRLMMGPGWEWVPPEHRPSASEAPSEEAFEDLWRKRQELVLANAKAGDLRL